MNDDIYGERLDEIRKSPVLKSGEFSELYLHQGLTLGQIDDLIFEREHKQSKESNMKVHELKIDLSDAQDSLEHAIGNLRAMGFGVEEEPMHRQPSGITNRRAKFPTRLKDGDNE